MDKQSTITHDLPNTAVFYHHYRQIESEVDKLGDVESELAVLDKAIDLANQNITERSKALENNLFKQDKRVRELENRQNNPVMKTPILQPHLWLNGGIEGRIERQKAKLAKEQIDEPKLRALVDKAKEDLIPTSVEREEVQQKLERQREMRGMLQQMFDKAVDMFPSQRIGEISISISDVERSVAQIDLILRTLEQCIQDALEARSRYTKAGTALADANAMDARAAEDYSRRGKLPQRMLNRRDRSMAMARTETQRASELLDHSISSIPTALRESYPQTVAQIAHFNSPPGSPSDPSAYKVNYRNWPSGIGHQIGKESALVRTGNQHAAHCEAMLHSLLEQSRLDAEQTRAKLVHLKEMLKAEKVAVFHSVETSMLTSGPQPGMQIQQGVLLNSEVDEAPAIVSELETISPSVDQTSKTTANTGRELTKEEEEETLRRAQIITQAHLAKSSCQPNNQSISQEDTEPALKQCAGVPMSTSIDEELEGKCDINYGSLASPNGVRCNVTVDPPAAPHTAIAPTAPSTAVDGSMHGPERQLLQVSY